MTVERGASLTNVGNSNFWSNPLRLYLDQEITFDVGSGKTIDQVRITVNGSRGAEALINAYYEDDVDTFYRNNVVIIKPIAGLPTIELELDGTVDFSSLIIYYN